ncbi:hypothetical protein FTUN_3173 [Frigoriglobus tundricola]|uniref:Uncharacterized protein n=2 Tax=Frigoriglobus tundricola TaxID=2774151 RepID=A0A6M5YRM7_9BACT|nr:hypothetical protein FTUN_3173 [Frigoriglobus tundricola]
MNTLTAGAARAKTGRAPGQARTIQRTYEQLIRGARPRRVFFFSTELSRCLPLPKRMALRLVRQGHQGLTVRAAEHGCVFLSFLPE